MPTDDPGGVRALLAQLREQQDAPPAAPAPAPSAPARRPWVRSAPAPPWLRRNGGADRSDAQHAGVTDEAYDPSAPALFGPAAARTPAQRTDWRTVPQAAAAERLAALKEDAAFRRELQKVRQDAPMQS